MKKLSIYIAFILLSLSGFAQNLTPDATWIDGNHRDWCDKNIGTAFTSVNGVLHAFNYQGNGIRKGGHLYMYTINEANKTTQTDLNSVKMSDYAVGPDESHNNRVDFKYPGEGSSYDEGAEIGRAFCFQFDGRTWFSHHIRSANQGDHDPDPANESYECYAELPTSTSSKCFTYYETKKPAATVVKQGGFQYDSLMYFLTFDLSVSPARWIIQEYTYSTSDKKFHKGSNDIILSLSLPYLGGIFRRIDKDNKEYMMITFYDQIGHYVVGKLSGTIVNNKRSFTWSSLLADTGTNPFSGYKIAATTMAEGTMRANRTASQITNKEYSDRMVLFGELYDKSSDGYYHVRYAEFHFENDQLVRDMMGELTLPSSTGPSKVGNYYHLYACSQLKPMDYTGNIVGIDGYQQYIWLLYPDHNRHFNGGMLMSDHWQNNPNTWVESTDLDQDSLYEGITDLWSLMGIIDGPPPVSMNWPVWDDTWVGPTPASSLVFETDSSGKSEFTTQTSHEWSVGESVDVKMIGKRLKGSLGEKFKYSQTWENTVSNSNSSKITYELPFELYEEYQPYGYYIYSVPEIRRFSYSLYPWWETSALSYPVKSSFQYLFQTIATNVVPLPVTLSSFPFYVNNPNSSTMSDWTASGGRSLLRAEAVNNGLWPCMHLDWTHGSGGSTMNIQQTNEHSTTDQQSHSWEFEITAGVTKKVPKVCQIEAQMSTGYKGSLMNETKTSTEYGKKISASLENLYSPADGINLSTLHMDCYLFTHEFKPDWWFYDSLNGMKPFYLAWVVTSSTQGIIGMTPADGATLKSGDLVFSWRPDHGSLYNYELVVSRTSNMSKQNALYWIKAGDGLNASIPGFTPVPGETYYWGVRALDENGEVVYSPVMNFMVEMTAPETETPILKSVVVPNPGTSEQIHILVDPGVDGIVNVTLVNPAGITVFSKEKACKGGMTEPFSFAETNVATGIYFAVIRTAQNTITHKVIVQ